MRRWGSVSLRRAMAGAAAASLLVTVPMVSAAPAAGSCTQQQRPQVFPEDQLQPGMMATGLTTIQGRTPQSFDAQILGVLPDFVLPGQSETISALLTHPASPGTVVRLAEF